MACSAASARRAWSWPRRPSSPRSNRTEQAVRDGLEGKLCRCTGYRNIVKAVLAAAGAASRYPCPFEYIRAEAVDHTLRPARPVRRRGQGTRRWHLATPAHEAATRQPRSARRHRRAPRAFIRPRRRRSCRGRRRSLAMPTLSDRDLLRLHAPLLAHVAGQIGDPQVRHRGTHRRLRRPRRSGIRPARRLCSRSVATLVAYGPRVPRVSIPSTLLPGLPRNSPGARRDHRRDPVPKAHSAAGPFQKFTRRAPRTGDRRCRVRPQRHGGHRARQHGRDATSARRRRGALDAGPRRAAADLAAEGTTPGTDLHASAEYRRHLARVLVRRALDEASHSVT